MATAAYESVMESRRAGEPKEEVQGSDAEEASVQRLGTSAKEK